MSKLSARVERPVRASVGGTRVRHVGADSQPDGNPADGDTALAQWRPGFIDAVSMFPNDRLARN